MQPLTRSLSLPFPRARHPLRRSPFCSSSCATLHALLPSLDISETLSIILTLVDYTRAEGILLWRRRVAALLKFHTRWPTYQNPPLRMCLASSPEHIRHTECFLSEGTNHYASPAYHPPLPPLFFCPTPSPLSSSENCSWKEWPGSTFTRRAYATVWRRAMLTRSSKVSQKLRTKSRKWRKVHRAERSLRSTEVLYLPSTER